MYGSIWVPVRTLRGVRWEDCSTGGAGGTQPARADALGQQTAVSCTHHRPSLHACSVQRGVLRRRGRRPCWGPVAPVRIRRSAAQPVRSACALPDSRAATTARCRSRRRRAGDSRTASCTGPALVEPVPECGNQAVRSGRRFGRVVSAGTLPETHRGRARPRPPVPDRRATQSTGSSIQRPSPDAGPIAGPGPDRRGSRRVHRVPASLSRPVAPRRAWPGRGAHGRPPRSSPAAELRRTTSHLREHRGSRSSGASVLASSARGGSAAHDVGASFFPVLLSPTSPSC